MNWNLAIETNHEALKRILAMLVAMVEMAGDAMPIRHNHQKPCPAISTVLCCSLPASGGSRDAAADHHRRARAGGEICPCARASPRRGSRPSTERTATAPASLIRPGPLPEWARALVPKRSPSLSLSLLDPLKRFGVRRRYAKPAQCRRSGFWAAIRSSRFFRRPEPPPPPPPPPTIRSMRAASISGSKRSGLRWIICRSKRNAWRAGRRAGCEMGGERGDAEHPGQTPPHRLALRARHFSPTGGARNPSWSAASHGTPAPPGERCRARRARR